MPSDNIKWYRFFAFIAQWIEHRVSTPLVGGSSPSEGARNINVGYNETTTPERKTVIYALICNIAILAIFVTGCVTVLKKLFKK